MLSLHRHTKEQTSPLSVENAYNLWASTYDDEDANPLILIEEKLLTPYLTGIGFENKSVIDFGCGTGRHFHRYIAGKAKEIIGVDISKAMLDRARQKFNDPSVVLIESSIAHIPYEDASADVGISTLTLGFVHDLAPAITEMSRVLRPNGMMLIADLHPNHKALGWKRNFTIRSGDSATQSYEIENYAHSIAEYRHAFGKTDLEIEYLAEPFIDSTVQNVFEHFDAMKVYKKHLGDPILLIFKLRKH
jgi:ubiquinone/menaquinone biosynthesis C-methylase UbiE